MNITIKVRDSTEQAGPQPGNENPNDGNNGFKTGVNFRIQTVLEQINRVILGKEHQVKLAVACLLSDGHLLIDDIPGVGKTTFSRALAKSFGLGYKRVQFTSDLLPPLARGIHNVSEVIFSSTYPIGLFTWTLSMEPEDFTVWIYPEPRDYSGASLYNSRRSSGDNFGDFDQLTDWQPGDSLSGLCIFSRSPPCPNLVNKAADG